MSADRAAFNYYSGQNITINWITTKNHVMNPHGLMAYQICTMYLLITEATASVSYFGLMFWIDLVRPTFLKMKYKNTVNTLVSMEKLVSSLHSLLYKSPLRFNFYDGFCCIKKVCRSVKKFHLEDSFRWKASTWLGIVADHWFFFFTINKSLHMSANGISQIK